MSQRMVDLTESFIKIERQACRLPHDGMDSFYVPPFLDKIHEIFNRILLRAFFSRRDTCACEMPTSAEISVCVFPS